MVIPAGVVGSAASIYDVASGLVDGFSSCSVQSLAFAILGNDAHCSLQAMDGCSGWGKSTCPWLSISFRDLSTGDGMHQRFDAVAVAGI